MWQAIYCIPRSEHSLLYNLVFFHQIHSPAADLHAFHRAVPALFPALFQVFSYPESPGCREEKRIFLQPRICTLHIFPVRRAGRALVKSHGDRGSQIGLDLHALLRSHEDLPTVDMGVEIHALLLYFA